MAGCRTFWACWPSARARTCCSPAALSTSSRASLPTRLKPRAAVRPSLGHQVLSEAVAAMQRAILWPSGREPTMCDVRLAHFVHKKTDTMLRCAPMVSGAGHSPLALGCS